MKVLVCGGRDFHDYDHVESVLNTVDSYADGPITHLIHGGARGADSLAHRYAMENQIRVITVYPAQWNQFDKAAGMIRNRAMLKEMQPDLVVAFPGGVGTAGMVSIAKKAGVKVLEIQSGS